MFFKKEFENFQKINNQMINNWVILDKILITENNNS
jgi:hypothetical protein